MQRLKRTRAGELVLTNANAYVDTFVHRAVEMLWSARKDVLQLNLPWVEKESDGVIYREYRGSVSVVHDGLVVDVAFEIDLFPERGEMTNVFGWSPRNRLACRIRSLPEVRGIEVTFDLNAAAGKMFPRENRIVPIEAVPEPSGISPHNVVLIRRELDVAMKPKAV